MNGAEQRERCFYIENRDFFSIIKQLIDPSWSLLDVGCGQCGPLGSFACKWIVGVEIHWPYLETRINRLPHILPYLRPEVFSRRKITGA